MKFILALSILVVLVYSDDFTWKNCGPSNFATVNKLTVSPDPLVFPGKVTYDAEVEIKQPLKNVQMQLKIVRNTFFLDVTLPCVKQIGSCTYNKMCSFVDDMVAENWGDIGAKIGNQILARSPKLGENDLCATGLQPQIIKSQGSLDIPELPSILKFVAAGDYTVRLEFTNNVDGTPVACLEAKTTMERGGSVWGRRSRLF